MNLVSRRYKFVGHSDFRLYSSIPSLEGRMGGLVDGNGNPVIIRQTNVYDSDESNEQDVDAAMGIEGWEPDPV